MSNSEAVRLMKVFTPNIGIGTLTFNNTEEEIISILGKPESREKVVNDKNSYLIDLYFDVYDISVFLHYENKEFDYLSIHTNNLIFNDIEFSKVSKLEIIAAIEDYYTKNGLEKDVIIEKELSEQIYTYHAIGLTIWFEKDEIIDICVEMPE